MIQVNEGSSEYLHIVFKRNGVAQTVLQYVVVEDQQDYDDGTPLTATVIDGKPYAITDPTLVKGIYKVIANFASNPENVIKTVGFFEVV